MATRLVSVVVDTPDPAGLAAWWGAALGWPVEHYSDDESETSPPPGEPGVDLTFVKVDDPRVERNRIHLDLRSSSVEDQAARVARLLDAGAKRTDIGQGDVPWEVLEDPEGNVFCVLEPRPEFTAGALASIVVEAGDPASLARFWIAASGWKLASQSERVTSLVRPDGSGPWLEFVTADRPRSAKNRVHLDVAPGPLDEQGMEVSRLHALGARSADVGQGVEGITWVVLSDPEDNEFCVLSPR